MIDSNDDFIHRTEPQIKGPPIERLLFIPYSDLERGTTRRVKIKKKKLISKTISSSSPSINNDNKEPIIKIIYYHRTIKIKPGTSYGTRFTFERAGDEYISNGQNFENTIPADVVFIVTEPNKDFVKQQTNNETKRQQQKQQQQKTYNNNNNNNNNSRNNNNNNNNNEGIKQRDRGQQQKSQYTNQKWQNNNNNNNNKNNN